MRVKNRNKKMVWGCGFLTKSNWNYFHDVKVEYDGRVFVDNTPAEEWLGAVTYPDARKQLRNHLAGMLFTNFFMFRETRILEVQ